MTRSLKKNPFVANHLLRKIKKLNTKAEKEIIVTYLMTGERRELNPRMVDSQSTALIHLATSAPYPAKGFSLFSIHYYSIYSDLHTSIEIVDIGCHSLK